MDKILELRQQRAALVKQAREMLDKAETEKRDLTQEETNKHDVIMADVDKMESDIARREKLAEAEQRGAESAGVIAGATPVAQQRTGFDHQAAFRSYVVGGRGALSHEELRAMQVDSDTGGGYLVPPQQFVTDLIKGVDDQVFIRGLATVRQLRQAESLGVVALDTDLADADWTTELLTGSEGEMAFGKRELRPHPIAKLVKLSRTLIRKAALSPEALVRDRMAYKFGVTMEKAYLTGNGAQKPLGVFTASDDGIGTARDVSTGNTDTEIRTDGLIEAKFALKLPYWQRARWVFHRDGVKQIRKLKDGNGQYIWQPGISAMLPDRILEVPYLMSEYAPNTFTTGLYAGIIGDFSYYWIVDALDMTVQRLEELYATTNQGGFIGRMEGDGMPVLAEAFARVKLA